MNEKGLADSLCQRLSRFNCFYRRPSFAFVFLGMRSLFFRILVVGGSHLSNGAECVPESEIFCIEGDHECINKTTTKPPNLNFPRRGANLLPVKVDDRTKQILLAGGSRADETFDSIEVLKCRFEAGGQVNLDEKWRLSKWKLLARRSCAMAVRFNDDLLMLGGFDGQNCLKSVESHKIDDLINDRQPTNENSKFLPDLISPIKNGVVVSLQDCGGTDISVLIFGGWDGQRTLDTIFKYDPSSGEMTFVGRLPYPIECHTVSTYGDKIYLAGGFDGIRLRDEILIVDRRSLEVKVADGGRLKVPRECHSSSVSADGQHLAVVGGWNGLSALSSVEIFKLLPNDTVVRVELEGVEMKLRFERNRLQSCLLSN